MDVFNLQLFFLAAGAYLIGSLPTGLFFVRFFFKKDIRDFGSGNAGATNVGRTLGKRAALVVLLADLLKGAVPVLLAMMVTGSQPGFQVGLSLAAVAAVLGNLYPVYLKGRSGGKGVAITLGCFSVISPAAVAAALLVFLLIARLKHIPSIASLSAMAMLPFLVLLETKSFGFCITGVVTTTLIFIRHSENIRRLRKGEEPPWQTGKKPSGHSKRSTPPE